MPLTTPVRSSGLASNIDTEGLIQKLVSLQAATLQRLSAKKTSLTSLQSAYDTLAEKLETLESASDALKSVSTYNAKITTSSNADLLSATASESTTAGKYNIEVIQRAKSTQLIGVGTVSNGTPLDLNEEVGSGTNNLAAAVSTDGRLNITIGETTTTVDYATTDSLQSVFDRIKAETGVTVKYDQLADRIIATNDGGSSDGLSIEDDTGFLASALNLTSTQNAQTVLGQAAKIKIDGVNTDGNGVPQAISSTDDIFTSEETGVAGLSLSLKKDTGTTLLDVGNDTAAISTNFTDFATAYNDVVQYIAEQSASTGSGSTRKIGLFSGDQTIRTVSRELRSMLAAKVDIDGQPDNLSYLSGLGIGTTGKGASISVNSDTLTQALTSNLDAVKNLLTDSSQGILKNFDSYLVTQTTSTKGLIKSKSNSTDDQVRRLDQTLLREVEKLKQFDLQLRKSFDNMERLISQYQGGIDQLLGSLGTVSK